MLGLLHGHAIDVIDFLADVVIPPAMRRAGQSKIIVRSLDDGAGVAKRFDGQRFEKVWDDGRRRRPIGIAFADHHPADIIENIDAMLIVPDRSDIDDAALAVRIFLQTDDFEVADNVSPG